MYINGPIITPCGDGDRRGGSVMFILMVLMSSLFLGIMVPAAMISLFHGATVKLLEALRFYKKGALAAEKRTIITGSGHYRFAAVYATRMPGGGESFENGKVFLFLLLVFEALFLLLGTLASVLVYFLFGYSA